VKVTGSSLPVFRSCQWWARPEVETPPPSAPTPEMLLGTEVHAAIEVFLAGQTPKLSDEAQSLFETWRAWWQQSPLRHEAWLTERPYAYSTTSDTARPLEVASHRRYTANADEIAGTIDALALDAEHGHVVDWKTGKDFGRMTADAAGNWQLRFYALALARAHRLDSVTVHVVRISDEVTHTSHTLDALDLDAAAHEIARLARNVPYSKPEPGSHCRRCRAVAVCPSTSTSTKALVATVEPAKLEISSPEQATELYLRLRQVQAACEQVEAALKAYASEGGISLPGGRQYRRISSERETITLNGPDGALARDAIHAAGAHKAVELKYSVSKAAIERELKAAGLAGKELRAKMEALYAELRVAGAVRSTTIDSWRES